MGTVYLIRAGDDGLVKIGHTTQSIEHRLRTLQTGSSRQLRVIRTLNGPRRAERKFHEHFSERRRHGEWFDFDKNMMSFVPSLDAEALKDQEPCRETPAQKQIKALGGFNACAAALGVGYTAVTNAGLRGTLPSSWFHILEGLSKDRGVTIDRRAFSFRWPESAA